MTTKTYDCNNPQDQAAIVANHSISQATFNNYLSNFFGAGATAVEPMSMSWNEMEALIGGADCTTMRLKLEMDENDTANNNIDITLEPLLETTVNYSIALFKGVKLLHDVASFHFFKAKKANNDYDIIFAGVNNNNQNVYLGDLSDLYP